MGNPVESVSLLEERWSNCERCRLHASREQTAIWRGNPFARILFVSSDPITGDDEKSGTPLSGAVGGYIDNLFFDAGVDPYTDVFFTAMTACISKGVPSDKQVRKCFPRVKKLSIAVKPYVVVLSGNTSAKMFLGDDYSVSDRGKVWPLSVSTKGGGRVRCKALITYPPKFLAGCDESYRVKFKRDVARAFRLANAKAEKKEEERDDGTI